MTEEDMDFSYEHADGVFIQTGSEILEEGFSEIEIRAEFDAAQTIVMLEQLDGMVDAVVDDHGAVDVSKSKSVKIFFVKNLRRGQKVALRIRAAMTSSIRVSVAYVAKQLQLALDDLPCTLCKTLMRILVTALLASFGVPNLSAIDAGGVDLLTEEQIESLKVFFEKSVPDEFVEFFDSDSWGVIKKTLIAFDWATKAIDKLYTGICIKLGSCKDEPASNVSQNNLNTGGNAAFGGGEA